MADAMEPARQVVQQEAANELVGGKRHDLLAVGTAAAIVLVAEGDTRLVEADEAGVRDGDAMGVAREIGEHRFGAEASTSAWSPDDRSLAAGAGDGTVAMFRAG